MDLGELAFESSAPVATGADWQFLLQDGFHLLVQPAHGVGSF